MPRVREATIGCPPVAHEDPREVSPQDRHRVVKTPPGTNVIDGRVRGGIRPQPVQHGADAPAGFIGADHGTPADLGTQSRVGRGGHTGGAMQRLHEPAWGDRQPEALAQQRGDLVERHADVFVQEHNEGDGAGPQVHVGGPQCVGRLQRMPALDATATRDTAADRHVEAPDDRPDHREVFLILRRDACPLHRASTAGTRLRQRCLVGHVDVGGNRASGAAPIPATGVSPPWPPATLRPIFGERGRLPEPGAPRGIQLALQALVVPLQTIALTRQARHVVAQVRQCFCLLLDQLVARVLRVLRRTRPLIGHTRFMADSREKYKHIFVSSVASPAK